MMAELVDTMARREDDGGRGYNDGAAAGALAMVGNGEGEALGTNGEVQGVGATTWRSSRHPGLRAASRWRRGELRHAGVTSLPAQRGRSSWLARASTVLGRQVGRLVTCQVSSFLSLFLFYYLFCFVF